MVSRVSRSAIVWQHHGYNTETKDIGLLDELLLKIIRDCEAKKERKMTELRRLEHLLSLIPNEGIQ